MSRRLSVVGFIMTMLVVLPVATSAKRITTAGSVTITRSTGAALNNELVVVTVMSNPGLEKTVTQQLPLPGPLYVLPFFIDHEKGNSGGGNLDTVIALTNTTDAPLSIRLTIRQADGVELAGSGHVIDLGPRATAVRSLSDLIE